MNHPPLPQLADHLRAVAKLLDQSAGHQPTRARNGTCRCVTCRAHLLGTGSIGYPTATLGDGTGTRTTNDTTTTERAALNPRQWDAIDTDLAHTLRAIWHAGLTVQTLVGRVNAQAPDDDPVPAGTGPCTIRTCETVCRPDHKHPDNRLRSGLCPACFEAWRRYLKKHPAATLIGWRPVRTAALRPRPIAS